jgi:hypothetical protein
VRKDGKMTAEDILCPLCGGAVELDAFTQDEHGLAVHVLCYTLKKQGMRSDPPQPRKHPNPGVDFDLKKGPHTDSLCGIGLFRDNL